MRHRVNGAYGWLEANPVTVMLVALGLGCFATVAVVGVALRGEETRRIVEHSPCVEDPGGALCQQVKRETDEERSVTDTCIAFRKVGFVPCPHSAGPGGRDTSSGDATLPAPAGAGGPVAVVPDAPAPVPPKGSAPKGGHPPAGDQGGGEGPTGPQGAAGPPGTAPGAPEVVPEKPGVVPQAAEAAGDVASQVLCTATAVVRPCPK